MDATTLANQSKQRRSKTLFVRHPSNKRMQSVAARVWGYYCIVSIEGPLVRTGMSITLVLISTSSTKRQRELLLLGSWGREMLRVKVKMGRYSGKRRKRRDERVRQWKFLKNLGTGMRKIESET
jgi:hypothetical protein